MRVSTYCSAPPIHQEHLKEPLSNQRLRGFFTFFAPACRSTQLTAFRFCCFGTHAVAVGLERCRRFNTDSTLAAGISAEARISLDVAADVFWPRSGRSAPHDEFDARFGVTIKVISQHRAVRAETDGPYVGFRTGKQLEGNGIGEK